MTHFERFNRNIVLQWVKKDHLFDIRSSFMARIVHEITDPSWRCFPSCAAGMRGGSLRSCSCPFWRFPSPCPRGRGCASSWPGPGIRRPRGAARRRRPCADWSASANSRASAAGSSADGTRAGACTGS